MRDVEPLKAARAKAIMDWIDRDSRRLGLVIAALLAGALALHMVMQ